MPVVPVCLGRPIEPKTFRDSAVACGGERSKRRET